MSSWPTQQCNGFASAASLASCCAADYKIYKIALLVFRTLTIREPYYLKDLISIYSPVRTLRSSISTTLAVSTAKNKAALAGRAFQNVAPLLWNGTLSQALRTEFLGNTTEKLPINSFKCKLKHELFLVAFGDGTA